MRIDLLLAEDDGPKAESIRTVLRAVVPTIEVREARSVRSAIDHLRGSLPRILLLDMSLPTFDIVIGGETGGRPQSAGGIEVLDFMRYSEMDVLTLIITQHDAFEYNGRTIDVGSLISKLGEDYPACFRGLIQYNTISGQWKQLLASHLEPLLPGAKNECFDC